MVSWEMEETSYFQLGEWAIIISFAVAGALLNTYIPMKDIVQGIGIPGPAAGMALFGGFIFVVWISLAYKLVRKRYTGIIVSLLLVFIILLFHPWYGVENPFWFSIYGIIGLFFMGLIIELTEKEESSLLRPMLGGGLGNLTCLVITWVAIGTHLDIWVPLEFCFFLVLGAVVSGAMGVLIAHAVEGIVKKVR